MEERVLRQKYNTNKSRAKHRGIPWEFTFETWWELWKPHINQRGQGASDLSLCRHRDDGPYNPENCRIDTQANNQREKGYFGLMGNNSSGISGVRWDKRKGKWTADIQHQGKRIQKTFGTILDAAAWRISTVNKISGPTE